LVGVVLAASPNLTLSLLDCSIPRPTQEELPRRFPGRVRVDVVIRRERNGRVVG
jgi:hypothetical protein